MSPGSGRELSDSLHTAAPLVNALTDDERLVPPSDDGLLLAPPFAGAADETGFTRFRNRMIVS